MLLVGMGLAAGFFWWRSRSSRNASAAGRTSPIATEQEARDAKPPLAQEIAAIERSIPPPPRVQPLTSSVPEIAEAKPVVSAVGQQPVAPEPPIQETPISPLSAADLRLEADDIDALDPDTLALEMDIPAPPIAAASAPEGDALRALGGAEFDFLDDLDSTATKLDLARAYREMGDSEGAREILKEVIEEGNAAQQQAARDLLATL
jgi:FimV-like protein